MLELPGRLDQVALPSAGDRDVLDERRALGTGGQCRVFEDVDGPRRKGPGVLGDLETCDSSQHEPSLRAVRPIHEHLPRDIGKSDSVGVPARVGEGKQGPPEQVAELGPGAPLVRDLVQQPDGMESPPPGLVVLGQLPAAPGGGHGHPQLVHRESGKPVVAGDLGGQVRHVKSLELHCQSSMQLRRRRRPAGQRGLPEECVTGVHESLGHGHERGRRQLLGGRSARGRFQPRDPRQLRQGEGAPRQ